ncbi:hypothetical protein AMECASPLE_014333 [Ameca splendens]|uniref:Uncharacterized protein n=1 Tax=Ameca splendens TaxID=208324 RepID=A0ABV0Z121_9TELE
MDEFRFEVNHSIAALAGCLGPFCWKVNLWPSLQNFTASNSFLSRIVLFSFIRLPLTPPSFPVPTKGKPPLSMMLPPLCFNVKMAYSLGLVFINLATLRMLAALDLEVSE